MLRKSDSITGLTKALTKFQKTVPKITKNKTATVPMKNGGQYSYKYADLASIWDAIRTNLSDNGLAVIQSPTVQQTDPALTTVLMHESGEWVEDTMPLKITQDSPQGQGSAITYARRYALCSMLGIVADDDTDAQEHRVVNGVEKQRLVMAAKKVIPELSEDPGALLRFLTEVSGKHPSRILESEVDDVIQSIELYTQKLIEE